MISCVRSSTRKKFPRWGPIWIWRTCSSHKGSLSWQAGVHCRGCASSRSSTPIFADWVCGWPLLRAELGRSRIAASWHRLWREVDIHHVPSFFWSQLSTNEPLGSCAGGRGCGRAALPSCDASPGLEDALSAQVLEESLEMDYQHVKRFKAFVERCRARRFTPLDALADGNCLLWSVKILRDQDWNLEGVDGTSQECLKVIEAMRRQVSQAWRLGKASPELQQLYYHAYVKDKPGDDMDAGAERSTKRSNWHHRGRNGSV